MLKKKINGAWSDIFTLKKKTSGAWSDCSFAQKKNNGAWSLAWLKPLTFSSSSIYATINPPTTTKIETSSLYYSWHERLTDEMSTTYFANAGDTITIEYSHFTHRTNSAYLYTHSGIYFVGSTFTQNYSFVLAGGTSDAGEGGTFQTTATSTGFGTLTIRYENDNPNDGGSCNYGYVKIGNISIAGLQVYTCSI